MGIYLPRRLRQLPQGARAPANQWIDAGLVALFDASAGIELIGGVYATNNTGTRLGSIYGEAADFSGIANQQYAHRAAYAQLGAMSAVVFCDIDAGPGCGLLTKSDSSPTTDCPYMIYNNGSNLLLRRSAGASSALHTYGYTQSVPVSGLMYGVSATGVAGGATAVGYINGQRFAMAANELVPTDNGSSVWIGRTPDSSRQLDGRIYYAALFNKVLAPAQFADLYADPAQIFLDAPSRKYFLMWAAGAGGAAYTLAVTPAALEITGQPVGLRTARRLPVTAASTAITGGNVVMRVGRRLPVAPATVALSGQAVTMRAARVLPVASAALAITGQAVALRAARVLAVQPASLVINGQDVGLTYAGTAPTLPVLPAALTITGGTVGLRVTRRLAVAPATVAITPQDVPLRAARRMAVAPAAIDISPQAVGLRCGRVLPVQPATLTITAQAVRLALARRLGVEPASVDITGGPVGMLWSGAPAGHLTPTAGYVARLQGRAWVSRAAARTWSATR